jgi:hypothetical protein
VSPLTDEISNGNSKGEGVVRPVHDVYALGDCCANTEQPLPALAQVRGMCVAAGVIQTVAAAAHLCPHAGLQLCGGATCW